MKYVYLLVFYLLINLNSFSQWVEQILRPQNILQTDVSFFGNDFGLIIAQPFTVIRTTDGGQNWDTTILSIPNLYGLYCIYILNKDTAFIGGESGYMKTTNGGNSWTERSLDRVISICFTSSKIGYLLETAFGEYGNLSKIHKTVNGGVNWKWQYILNYTSGKLNKLVFCDSLIGYAIGNKGKIIKTANGGVTWVEQISNTNQNLKSICFLDSLTGYIVGTNGTILKTTDGGMNWINQNLLIAVQLNSVYFTTKNTGYTVGSLGEIIKTTDGGSIWSFQESNTNLFLSAVSFSDENTGYIVGDSGIILKTINGGNSIINISNNNFVNNLSYPNPFNNTTAIKYCQKEKGLVTITVYDFSGCIVETLINKELAPGDYEFNFNGAKHSSGVYFYSIKTDKHVYSGKMVLCN